MTTSRGIKRYARWTLAMVASLAAFWTTGAHAAPSAATICPLVFSLT